MDKLKALFEEVGHFEITHFENAPRLWQTDLFTKVMTFVRRYNSSECLIIIYYGAHAYDEKKSKAFMIAA